MIFRKRVVVITTCSLILLILQCYNSVFLHQLNSSYTVVSDHREGLSQITLGPIPLGLSHVSAQGVAANSMSMLANATDDTLRHTLEYLNSPIKIIDVIKAGDFQSSHSDVTVLSGLIDIGIIPAKNGVSRKDPEIYLKWMEIFQAVVNPLVFYTERKSVAKKLLQIRQQRPTIVLIIEKYTTWAFGDILPQYVEIFSNESYPKHYPNTIYPEYACVNHLKYEMMAIVSKWNYFHTEAAAWMDVGIYRDASDSGDFTPFIIRRLEGFEDKKMTFNYIREPRSTEVDHTYIMKYSPSFFCGCFWLGNMYVLQTFTTAYKKQVKVLLEEGLANCDEQVLATMFLEGTEFTPDVQAQYFRASSYENCDKWFCLGHITREKGKLQSLDS